MRIERHQSVVLLCPLNREAIKWVEDNCFLEEWQCIGLNQWAIDSRYAEDIAMAMELSGLRIERVRC